MAKDPTMQWFKRLVFSAFASVISFFHIDSWVADKNGINWLFWTIGIVFGLAALYCYYRANKAGNRG